MVGLYNVGHGVRLQGANLSMHETVAALPSPEWFALLQIAIATYFRILWRLQQHTADMRYAPVVGSTYAPSGP